MINMICKQLKRLRDWFDPTLEELYSQDVIDAVERTGLAIEIVHTMMAHGLTAHEIGDIYRRAVVRPERVLAAAILYIGGIRNSMECVAEAQAIFGRSGYSLARLARSICEGGTLNVDEVVQALEGEWSLKHEH